MITCYNQINNGNWAQEWYETSTGDAKKRAYRLRRAGYRVSLQAMGPVVTGAGVVKMTLVDIRPSQLVGDTSHLPNQELTICRL